MKTKCKDCISFVHGKCIEEKCLICTEKKSDLKRYKQEIIDNWADLNCDSCGVTISDADSGL